MNEIINFINKLSIETLRVLLIAIVKEYSNVKSNVEEIIKETNNE